jgi:hypothetical protein
MINPLKPYINIIKTTILRLLGNLWSNTQANIRLKQQELTSDSNSTEQQEHQSQLFHPDARRKHYNFSSLLNNKKIHGEITVSNSTNYTNKSIFFENEEKDSDSNVIFS